MMWHDLLSLSFILFDNRMLSGRFSAFLYLTWTSLHVRICTEILWNQRRVETFAELRALLAYAKEELELNALLDSWNQGQVLQVVL